MGKESTNEQLTTYRILDQTIGFADLESPFNWGSDGAGHDVKLFGVTAGHYLLWDTSEDDLILAGATATLSIDSTVDSTSAVTGSLHTDGGVGIAKALWVGTTSRLVGNVQMDGTLIVGNNAAGKDFKVYGETTGDYLEWDASAQKLNMVVASAPAIVATTVIAAEIASTGLFSGPPQQGTLIGLKVGVTGTGSNGMLAYGIYGLYTTVGKVMTGFYAAGAFETVSDNDTDQCDSAVVDLRDNDNGTAGHPATSYIRLRQKGSQNSAVGRRNFVNFYNEDEASAHGSGRMLVLTSDQIQTHSIRCFIDDAVIYLMATTTPPAA